jgi:hypothetical protein
MHGMGGLSLEEQDPFKEILAIAPRAARSAPHGPSTPQLWKLAAWIGGLASACAIGLLIYAVWYQSISLTAAASLIILTASFSISLVLFVLSMEKDDRLYFESHWGGLDGGLGGWRVSPSATFLLTSAALLIALVYTAGSAGRPALRERYLAAFHLGENKGIKFSKIHIASGKLQVDGTSPSEPVTNEFLDQVKLANPAYDDIVVNLVSPSAASKPPDKK